MIDNKSIKRRNNWDILEGKSGNSKKDIKIKNIAVKIGTMKSYLNFLVNLLPIIDDPSLALDQKMEKINVGSPFFNMPPGTSFGRI